MQMSKIPYCPQRMLFWVSQLADYTLVGYDQWSTLPVDWRVDMDVCLRGGAKSMVEMQLIWIAALLPFDHIEGWG